MDALQQYSATPTHELVWVSGTDAVGFVDDLVSQAIAPMAHGSVRRSFLLAPNGKLRALLWVLRGDERVGLIGDHGYGDRIIEDLSRFKLRVDVAFSGPLPLHTVLGVGLAAGAPLWRMDGDRLDVFPGTSDVRLSSAVPEGAIALDTDAHALLRIEEEWPVMGVDIDESTIPQETSLVAQAVDFTKGCYLGQELVARIDSRGHVNKRMAKVRIGAEVAGPPAGAVVSTSSGEAGVLTTTAPGVGMGLLRGEAGVGDRVRVAWAAGEAEGELIEFASG